MAKWVSIYFNESEYEMLEKVRKREEQRRGREVSDYELLKEWIMDKLNRLAKDGEEYIEPD